MLENLNVCGGVFTFNLLVMRIRSRVIMKPRAVMYRAKSFRWSGIVGWGSEVGGMLLVIRNPVIMLAVVRRLIGFSRAGLFSLIFVRVGKRGCPVRVRRMVRVL